MMENPFDQFDEPAAGGNPFDQFDEPAKPAPPVKPKKGLARQILEGAGLGIADIGNTVLNAATSPLAAVSPTVAQWNRTRNADFDALTEENKDNMGFTVGRVGANIAATLPVGGAIAGTASKVPGLLVHGNKLLNSIRSGGFVTGAAPATTLTGRAADLGVRALGGGITGGTSAALVNPEDVGGGAAIGAALPGFLRGMGAVGSKLEAGANRAAESMMQSAIKPTIKQLQSGDAATAVRMMLDYGISPNAKGAERLREIIGGLNTQISNKIANSTATVDKAKVMTRLDDTKRMFGNQVSPTSDLAAIDRVGDDFLAHPLYPGTSMPVQAAQQLKQGTYKTLAKKYGQLGGAETEAQKGLARGLKEEIADAVPEIAGLNAQEAKLITTLKVAERRALMELNKNPVGLAALAQNPAMAAMFMADKSAAFKALTARMINGSAGAVGGAAPALDRNLSNPLLRNLAIVPGAGGARE